MAKIEKYISIFRLSVLHAIKNYKALIGLSVFLMACLVIFSNLWKIAAAKIGASDFNADQLLWYIAFNEWILVSIPDIEEEMEEDLKSGRLAYLLPRPISYLGATFSEAIGTLFVNLAVLGTATFLFTWWQTGALPFHAAGFMASIFLGAIAGVIAVIFQMSIGLSAFWLHEVSPVYWIWEKLLFMLGGLMLPLAVYPDWLQTVARFTPFPAILGERSALALTFNSSALASVGSAMILWGSLAVILLLILYRRGLRILNIEGG